MNSVLSVTVGFVLSLLFAICSPQSALASSEGELIKELGPKYLRAGFRRARTHKISFTSQQPQDEYVLRLMNGNGQEIQFQKCRQRSRWQRYFCRLRNRVQKIRLYLTKVRAVSVSVNGKRIFKDRRFFKTQTFKDIPLKLESSNRFKVKVRGFYYAHLRFTLFRVNSGNLAPLAEFSAQPSGANEPLSMSLDASTSSDSDGEIASYSWDLGDGNTASGETIEHTYADFGEYTVKLIVTDDDGAQGEVSQQIVVEDSVAPILALSSPNEGDVINSHNIALSGSSNETLASASVNGQALTLSADGKSFSGSLNVNQDGVVNLQIQGVDLAGNIGTLSRSVEVSTNAAPTGEIFYGHEVPSLPAFMIFQAKNVDDVDGTVDSIEWDFGDGSQDSGENVNHLYFNAGTFTVTLTLTDDQGAQTVITEDIVVDNNQLPVSQFSFTPSGAQAPATISFDGSSSSDPEGGNIILYQWTVSDGREFSGQNVDISFQDPGEYQIELMVLDELHGIGKSTQTVIITESAAPVIHLVINNDDPSAPAVFEFDASTSFDPDGSIVSFAWTFGDGGSGTGSVISHTYLFPGNYPLELRVTDDNGDVALKTMIIQVQ